MFHTIANFVLLIVMFLLALPIWLACAFVFILALIVALGVGAIVWGLKLLVENL